MSFQGDAEAALQAGIAELVQHVAELSMLVIEAYQSACAGLIIHERDVSLAALNTAHGCAGVSQEVHRAAVRVLAAWTPTGERLSQVMWLQRTAAEYERMGTRVARIAEATLRLPMSADRVLAQVSRDAPDLLLLLVRHTYVMLRASLLITVKLDRNVALHVMREYETVAAQHKHIRQLASVPPAASPQVASALLPLGAIIDELGYVAESAAGIARETLGAS